MNFIRINMECEHIKTIVTYILYALTKYAYFCFIYYIVSYFSQTMNVRKPKKICIYYCSLSIGVIYTITKNHREEREFLYYISTLKSIIGESQDCNYNREQKAGNEAWKNAGHKVHVLFSLLFYTPQGH